MSIEPNSGRVIVELIKQNEKEGGLYIPNRENIKAGENLFVGRVVNAGKSAFKEGQIVMFMEYSMAAFYKDIKSLSEGKVALSEVGKQENLNYVIAQDDIMAFYDAETI